MLSSILPPNSSALEQATTDAITANADVEPAVLGIKQAKLVTRPPSFLPHLAYEYGLDELRELLVNPYDLIDLGRPWQAVRGSVSAIDMVLGWLGHAAAVEEAWTGRAFWNAFQLRLAELPASDGLLLDLIERGVSASVPKRSKLRRVVHHYDVVALELDRGRLDGCHLDWDSGVRVTAGTRDFPEAAKWSFGREHEVEHVYNDFEGLHLGNWLPVVEGGPAWIDIDTPWISADWAWAIDDEAVGRAVLASWFTTRTLHLVLRDGNDEVIGYRRCRAVHAVAAEPDGPYAYSGARYGPVPGAGLLYVEALTDFDDADGVELASVALLVGAEAVDGVPPGRLWFQPGEIEGGVEFARHDLSVPLRRTVRDRIAIMVRFDGPGWPVVLTDPLGRVMTSPEGATYRIR